MSRRVVIVGAGVAGWGAAQWLRPRAANADLEVTLVDKRPFHEFHALLYEVATGAAVGRPEDCERNLASGVCVNLTAYERLLKGDGVFFRLDEVTAIDRLTRRVQLRGDDALPYDALVLALGAESAFYGIPGLRELAIPLKSTQDALRIRRKILDLVDGVAQEPGHPLRVVVGGGGATGVEFAAELANALRALVARRVLRPQDYEITLVEGASRLLSAFPGRLSRAALQRLHHLGVRVHLDTFVDRVALGQVTLVPRALTPGEDRRQFLCGFDSSRHELVADCIIWTGGIQYPALLRDAGFPCDRSGRVLVDDTFLVQGETCVFAIGDCASCTPPKHDRPLQPLASIAVREAPVAARNVLACLDEHPQIPFHPHELPAIIPLGGKFAGCSYRNRTWIGRGPWVLRMLVDLRYFIGAFGVWFGFRVWWKGARVYVQND